MTTRLEHWFSAATDWPDAVLPDYDGGSIANLAPSILGAFNTSSEHDDSGLLPALRSDTLGPGFLAGARVVVLLVVDGFGSSSLAWARSHNAIEYLAGSDVQSAITSVFPSTTAAALTSIQTGASPGRHGMAGYTLYLSEQQATINMITWKPVGGVEASAPLPAPRGFLTVPTLYQRLSAAGIESSVVSNLAFMDSALTNIHSAGVPYRGHRTAAEFAGLLLKEARQPGRRFIFGYWDGFDSLSHTHGPSSEIALNEIHLLDRGLGLGFLRPLSRSADDVAVLVVADHGHTRVARHHIRSMRELLRRHSSSRPIPTGERRAVGLSFDDDAGLDALRRFARDDGVVLPVGEAIEAGLYGQDGLHPDLRERIGHYLLLAKNDASFVFPQSNNVTPGGHGSLTPQEMRVPLLGWRF